MHSNDNLVFPCGLFMASAYWNLAGTCYAPVSLSQSPVVDSNDSLYAGDRKLVAEVAKLVHTLLEQILEHMRSLTTSPEVCIGSVVLQTLSSGLMPLSTTSPSAATETSSASSWTLCKVMLFNQWMFLYNHIHTCLPPSLPSCFPHPSLPSSHTLHRLFVHADVSEDTNISTLLVNLWTLAQKHNLLERRLLVSLSQQCHWGYSHSQTICHLFPLHDFEYNGSQINASIIGHDGSV